HLKETVRGHQKRSGASSATKRYTNSPTEITPPMAYSSVMDVPPSRAVRRERRSPTTGRRRCRPGRAIRGPSSVSSDGASVGHAGGRAPSGVRRRIPSLTKERDGVHRVPERQQRIHDEADVHATEAPPVPCRIPREIGHPAT